jgi:hypothetical protein
VDSKTDHLSAVCQATTEVGWVLSVLPSFGGGGYEVVLPLWLTYHLEHKPYILMHHISNPFIFGLKFWNNNK